MSTLRMRRKSLPNACDLTRFTAGTLFPAEREEMPAEAADQRPRERVEGADEEGVEHGAFPAAVQPRLHRETLLDDAHFAKILEQRAELARAVLQQNRGVLVLERNLHQLRER